MKFGMYLYDPGIAVDSINKGDGGGDVSAVAEISCSSPQLRAPACRFGIYDNLTCIVTPARTGPYQCSSCHSRSNREVPKSPSESSSGQLMAPTLVPMQGLFTTFPVSNCQPNAAAPRNLAERRVIAESYLETPNRYHLNTAREVYLGSGPPSIHLRRSTYLSTPSLPSSSKPNNRIQYAFHIYTASPPNLPVRSVFIW